MKKCLKQGFLLFEVAIALMLLLLLGCISARFMAEIQMSYQRLQRHARAYHAARLLAERFYVGQPIEAVLGNGYRIDVIHSDSFDEQFCCRHLEIIEFCEDSSEVKIGSLPVLRSL